MGEQYRTQLFIFGGAVIFVSMTLLLIARAWERRNRIRATEDDGRVLGVTGLPGYGKTSFIVWKYVLPALRAGRTVVTNFEVFADDLPGRWVKLRPSTFANDLMGIGSSINLNEETGEPVSGWFIDTACTCGKDHDASCSRPRGDVPAGRACCRGFRARRLCGCNRVVVVVDEAQGFIPANQSKPLPIEVLIYFTMIRKNHVFFIWASQYWKWIHAAIRRLTPQGVVCEPGVLGAERSATLYDCDIAKAELLLDNPLTVLKFRPALVAGEWYDSGEVIVPSDTALELMGQMSKKHLAGGGGARNEHAAPVVHLLPPSTSEAS